MNNEFYKDFYPTPAGLIKKMLDGLKLCSIKNILDVGAGRGDIPDFISTSKFMRGEWFRDEYYETEKVYGKNSFNFDVIEINPDFHPLLTEKEYRVIHDDFLTFQTYKNYDLIIGNLPFSIGAECLQRVLLMIEETGGIARILVNAETIKNPCTNTRRWCIDKIEELKGEIEFLEDEFTEAERKTKVEVALIKIKNEVELTNSLILEEMQKAESLLMDESEPAQIVELDLFKQMIAGYNQECTAGIKLIKEFHLLKPYILDRLVKPGQSDYSKPMLDLKVEGTSYKETLTEMVNAYLRKVRGKYWEILLERLKTSGKYTSNVLKILYEKQTELKDFDFTLFNIRKLEKELDAKINQGVHDAILKIFDQFCNYSYRRNDKGEPDCDNVHFYDGWLTNKAHKINHKIILPINGIAAKWGSWDKDYKKIDGHYIEEKFVDMVKVFQTLEAEDQTGAHKLVGDQIYIANENRKDYKLYLRYFDVVFYKKGTCHITFKNQKLLDKLNIYGSQRKNWLPPNYGKKKYKDMTKEEQTVIDNFQGEAAYNEVMNNAEYYLVQPEILALSE